MTDREQQEFEMIMADFLSTLHTLGPEHAARAFPVEIAKERDTLSRFLRAAMRRLEETPRPSDDPDDTTLPF